MQLKISTLEFLCCPHCKSALSLQAETADKVVNEGCLHCRNCSKDFLIRNGVTRFIDTQEGDRLKPRVARFYDWFARFYDLFTKAAFLSFGGDRKARKEVLDRLELNGGRILEVSIGTGGNLPYLFESPDAGEVIGLDISAGQLRRCLRLVASRGWPVDLFLGTAEALPFKEASFDSVLHIGGINFFSNKRQAISEMIRVARPGSKIVIADESERLARMVARIPGFSPSPRRENLDASVITDLVPDTMKEVRMDGIWKAHHRYHGYCLEMRRPL